MRSLVIIALIILGFGGGYALGANDTRNKLEPVVSSQQSEIENLKYRISVNQEEYRELDAEFAGLVTKWNDQQEEIAEANKYDYYVEEQEAYSGGSWCNDGTWSPSVGSGTCSWHDGVAY